MSDPDVTPEDALQVAQRALAKVNELERELEETREDLAEAQDDATSALLRLSEHDEERPYDGLTLDEKIGMVRQHGFDKATDRANGKAQLDYDAIRWEVFDGEPGGAHCYDLMEHAAQADGFTVRDPSSGNKHLAIDADRAKRAREFFSEKKDRSVEGVE